MPIKLLVTHAGDDAPPDEYVFDQATVSIGRDSANQLTLPDPARVVSKHHAEVRDTGGAYQLVDLGSKNFTFLNGARLASGEPAVLSPGDAFTIGDFEIRFYPEAASEPELDRTVFAVGFVNPFEEPAERLAAVLGDLRRVYAAEAGPPRADALRDALSGAMIGGGDEPGAIVAGLLAGDDGRTAAEPPAYAPPAYAPPESPSAPGFRPPSGLGQVASDSRVDRLLDVLVRAVSKLVAIPWQFRHEFIGQTVAQAEDVAFLYDKTPAELKDFLLDPRAGAGELARRLGAIEEATEAVAVHQLAMLDGYKASVQDGAKRLLDEVDPGPVEQEVEASSPMYKLPKLRAAAVVERLKETHRELSGEDWSVAERRAFRPAFIKAYLARMTRRRA